MRADKSRIPSRGAAAVSLSIPGGCTTAVFLIPSSGAAAYRGTGVRKIPHR